MRRIAFLLSLGLFTALAQQRPSSVQNGTASTARPQSDSAEDQQAQAERQLRIGIDLTRHGRFGEAIPRLQAAKGVARDTFAVRFNLALCYLGVRRLDSAIDELHGLRGNKLQTAAVENLLAQAYVGRHEEKNAWNAFQKAAEMTPNDEKLYAFVSDACLDEGLYELGIKVTEAGLRNLPESARLYLQRGLLRSRLEQVASARRDFKEAARLAPDTDVGYIAEVQDTLSSGDVQKSIETARRGIRSGHSHYMLLTMLGEALLRAGVSDGTPQELAEAQLVLEQAVSARPGYASAQISLSKVYLIENRVADAIGHLELARQLDAANPAVYANLATAYRRAGDQERLREALTSLHTLNAQEQARVGSATEGHNGMATGPAVH